MAPVVKERFGSVRWMDDAKVDVGFVISGAADANDAHTALGAFLTGQSYNGIPLQSISIDEINENTGYWYGRGRFGFSRPPRRTGTKPDTSNRKDTYTWEVHLENQNETYFSGTDNEWTFLAGYLPDDVNAYAYDATALWRQPVALGWKGIEQPHAGLNVLRPTASFSLDYYPATATVTDAYVQGVAGAVGKVNGAIFNSFAIGEVMFAEARGAHTREDGWRFNFKFLIKRNRTDVLAALVPAGTDVDEIRIPSVDGWDMIEVYFQKLKQVTPDGRTIMQEIAQQAIVWRPHARVDFNSILFP